MAPPRRRWFRFSLRTLFVLMAVVGLGLVWLKGELRVIRQRKDVARLIEGRGGGSGIVWQSTWRAPGSDRTDLRKSRIPWWRTALGDDSAISIVVPVGEASLFDRARECFPEASVFFDVPFSYPPEREQDFRRPAGSPATQVDQSE
jgi:hypothetical protein